MDRILDYIVSNYVWFLVGFIVITMIIIGYVADTTDFWHKKTNGKKAKEKNETKSLQEAINNLKDKKLNDVLDNKPNNASALNEDLTVPLGDKPLEKVVPLSTMNPPTSVINEDLNVPLGDVIPPMATNLNNSEVSINEDLNAPLGDVIPPMVSNINTPLDRSIPSMDDDLSTSISGGIPTMNEDLNVPLSNSEKITPLSNIGDTINNSQNDFNNIDSTLDDDIIIPSTTNSDVPIAEIEKNDNSNMFNDFNFELPKNTDSKKEEKGINEVDYEEPIVPEFITDSVNSDSEEEDIWKF